MATFVAAAGGGVTDCCAQFEQSHLNPRLYGNTLLSRPALFNIFPLVTFGGGCRENLFNSLRHVGHLNKQFVHILWWSVSSSWNTQSFGDSALSCGTLCVFHYCFVGILGTVNILNFVHQQLQNWEILIWVICTALKSLIPSKLSSGQHSDTFQYKPPSHCLFYKLCMLYVVCCNKCTEVFPVHAFCLHGGTQCITCRG